MNTKQLEQLLRNAYPFEEEAIANYTIGQYVISLVLLSVRVYIIFTTGNVYNDYGSYSKRDKMLNTIDRELFLQMKNMDVQDGMDRNIDFREWYRVIEVDINDIGTGIRNINKAILEMTSFPEYLYKDKYTKSTSINEPLEGEVLSSTITDYQEHVAQLLLTDETPKGFPTELNLESGNTLSLKRGIDENGNTILYIEFCEPTATPIAPTTPKATTEPLVAQNKPKQVRMTKHRKAMLEVLTEISSDGECAPYNAETIEFLLSQKCGKDKININQINRTLRDLVKLGLVTYELREVRYSGTLPKKVRHYEAVEGMDRRRLWRETNEVIREANNSRGTVEIFKGPTEPFGKEQVGLLVDRIDKLVGELTDGNTDEYTGWVRSLLDMKGYALSDIDGIALWHKRNKENQGKFA